MRLVRLLFHAALLGLFACGAPVRGGVAPYTDPGKIDFDTVMERLNPYGTWAKVDDKWAFTPLDHAAPYTNGRWLYTEYGWFWKGNAPHSWMTEHYGYWKRGADKVWAWYPGPYWLPQTVEIRSSADGVGWRSAEVDRDGNFIEEPAARFTKTDEWTFVTKAQFAGPITPAIAAHSAASEQLLEESVVSIHSYLTYRELDRPGPHPADFINLGDGKMFAPMTDAERALAMRRPSTAKKTAAGTNAAPEATKPDAAALAASLTASAEMPAAPDNADVDPSADARQVKYWVTMSLPTLWTPPPVDAGRDQLYIYRPDFYQDQDGIERRITLWLNPSLRSSEAIHLADVLRHRPAGAAATNGPGVAPVPAASAGSDFSNPFNQPIEPTAGAPAPSHNSALYSAGAPTNAPPASPSSSPSPSALSPAPDGRAPQQPQ
jgi:hypothetical protein